MTPTREQDNAVTPGMRKPGEIAGPRNDAVVATGKLDCASEERSQTVDGTTLGERG